MTISVQLLVLRINTLLSSFFLWSEKVNEQEFTKERSTLVLGASYRVYNGESHGPIGENKETRLQQGASPLA